MFVVPIVFLALTQTGCEEALKPVGSALQQNERAHAATMLDSLRPQCANSSAFHELAGVTSSLNGNFTGAADDLGLAFTLNPQLTGDLKLVLWYAQALLETNQSARLTAFLSAHERSAPPPLLFSLATMFAKHRDYRQAIEYFRQIPTDVADDAVYFDLGLAYSHLRQFGDARKFYFQAIDHHPQHVEAYFRIGLDFAAAGDSRKAIPWLLRAREFAPARPDITYALIEQLLLLKYFDTAQQIVAESLAASPTDPLLMVAKGDVLLAQGTLPDAVAAFQAALKREPKLPSALLGLARADVSQGNTDGARKQLLTALSIEPEDPAINGELGSLELQQNNWSDAYAYLSKAWSSGQSNPGVAIGLARTLQHLNRAADALHLLQPLAPVLRDSTAYHFELMQLYAQLGKTADAQTERQHLTALQATAQNTLRFEDPKAYAH